MKGGKSHSKLGFPGWRAAAPTFVSTDSQLAAIVCVPDPNGHNASADYLLNISIQTNQAEMAAYAAVISLKHTINALLNSSSPSTAEMLESAYNQTTSLQQALQSFNDSSTRKRLDAVDGQIRDAAHRLEDVLEFHQLNLQQLLSERLKDSCSRKRVDDVDGQIRDAAHNLEDVLEFHEFNPQEEEQRKEITSFVEAAKKMEREYIKELSKPLTEEEADDAAVIVDFGVEMVGHATLFNTIRKHLLEKMRPIDSYFCSFLGENGSGRTAWAHTLFEEVGELYECCAWVTLGTTHEQLKEVVIGILEQVGNNEEATLLSESGEADEEMICKQLYKALDNRRYMIVLDDVCSVEVLACLRSSFPDQSNGSLLLLTTNQQEIARLADRVQLFDGLHFQTLMWHMLRHIFFQNERITPELEEAGMKIIDNCGCRIIPFLKSLVFLYDKTGKTVEEWSKIAADKEHPIFMFGDEISEMTQIKREMQSYNLHIVDEGRGCLVKLISGFYYNMSTEFEIIIHPKRFFSKMQIISLVGMCGIGKTGFAQQMIQDDSILSHFDHCVWLTLGPKYQAEQVLIDILAEIYPNADMKKDEKLVRELCVQLSSKRCLIVLDDLWSKEPLHHLKNLLPDIMGITLVTTTLRDVAKFGEDDTEYEIPFLDEEESWCLLRKKVFGGEDCPFELEKAGRKIAENCEGLPLLILTVAEELLKVERSQQFWNNVASGKDKSVFKNAHDQISKALLPRYQILPQHLKTCFLYIGVFRQKYKIRTSVFANLLIAEGFLESNIGLLKEEYVAECLSDLVQSSLVMVEHRAFPDSEFKTCHLHAVFWHLANTEAMKNEFFHALNSYDDCWEEKMRNQRRLCIRNSILLGFKDVQESMASITNAHSLLCVSTLQQYPVPIDFDMRLLRVMNAITIRLYEFPIKVVRLLHLRYLGLTFNGMLPTPISNLWKLQYLIVKRHMNIKSFECYWLLPMEIWDMKELKHLEFMGGRLPNPNPNPTCGAALPKLTTLLDVSVESCTEEVLKMIPNLKRLGIRIELAPNDDELLGDSFLCLNNVCRLSGLESLKCVVVNPQIRAGVVPPLIMLPRSLKRLSLSGMGYPWEYMTSMLDGLQNLQVLKLKHYAFQGPKWEWDRDTNFNRLKSLSIEDTNLVQWKFNRPIRWGLEHLCFKHCYKLKELPMFAYFASFKKIEIVKCSPFAVTWAHHAGELSGLGCEVKVDHLGAILIPTNNDFQ